MINTNHLRPLSGLEASLHVPMPGSQPPFVRCQHPDNPGTYVNLAYVRRLEVTPVLLRVYLGKTEDKAGYAVLATYAGRRKGDDDRVWLFTSESEDACHAWLAQLLPYLPRTQEEPR